MNSHESYLKHREERIAQARTWIEANREKHNEYARQYYYRHREERRGYYQEHREERLAYSKAHPREYPHCQTVIKHNGKVIVKNVHKPPKPLICTLCRRRGYLTYHHWEDDKPDIGLWICNGCHAAIHRMIKIGLLEANIKSQDIILCALLQKEKVPSPSMGEGCLIIV